MNDLYANIGFKENPFSKFSAEEEKKYLGEIYIIPKYYNALLSEIKMGIVDICWGKGELANLH